MYLLNNRKEEHREGLTIEQIILEKNYTYNKKNVYINGELIKPNDYSSTVVNEGDDVRILHLLAGG